MIPYSSRTVDIILHPDCPLPKRGAKDVIDLLQARDLSTVVEAVVQIAPERYRITFNNARQMNAFSHQDFSIMGLPVEFRSVSPFTWVHVSRLSYGIPDEAITSALAPFSAGIKTVSQAVHKGIYTGERNVLMKIVSNIPGRLRIAGHWCVVRYSGQRQVCFRCHKEGHVIGQCPSATSTSVALTSTPPNTGTSAVTTSTATTSSATPQASYAAVTSGVSATPLTQVSPDIPQLTSADPSTAPVPAAGPTNTPAPSDENIAASPSLDVSPPASASSAIHSPVRRRAKRRRSPLTSPQPHEKKAAPEAASTNDADPLDHSPHYEDISSHSRESSVEPVPLTEDSADDSAAHDYETDNTLATEDPEIDGNSTTDTTPADPMDGLRLVNSGYDTVTDTPDDLTGTETVTEDLVNSPNNVCASLSEEERREAPQPLRKEGLQALNEACKEAFLPQPSTAARQALDLFAAAALPLPEGETDF